MQDWMKRHKGAIVFTLTLIIAVLLLANAWKHRIVSVQWLTDHKDALSALNSIATLVILLAGAIFSYYRFFRGRTLSLRAELDLEVSIHQVPTEGFFHAARFSAKNVGTSTIWNPRPHLRLELHGAGKQDRFIEIEHWWEQAVSEADNESAAVIEPDETVYFFAQRPIPVDVWAVTYWASLEADSGDTWHIAKTVSNCDQATRS